MKRLQGQVESFQQQFKSLQQQNNTTQAAVHQQTCTAVSNMQSHPHERIDELQLTKQEIEEYKRYLSEAQEEIQALQAQLIAAKRSAAASVSTVKELRQQLLNTQQLNNQLRQELSVAAGTQQQQLAATKQQLNAVNRQLAAAKEAASCKQQQLQELSLQLEQQKMQQQQAADQAAAAKSQASAARSELKRVEAATAQQLAAMAADLDAARAAETAALADAHRARAAESTRSRQLAETEDQLIHCRGQLQLAGDIHSQLSRLQAALLEHKQQEKQRRQLETVAAADAEQQREQHNALAAELSQYKVMLSEAQEEVARLQGDSRQLAALRRSSLHSAMGLAAMDSTCTSTASSLTAIPPTAGAATSQSSSNGLGCSQVDAANNVCTVSQSSSSQIPSRLSPASAQLGSSGGAAAVNAAGACSLPAAAAAAGGLAPGPQTPIRRSRSSCEGASAAAASMSPVAEAVAPAVTTTTCSPTEVRPASRPGHQRGPESSAAATAACSSTPYDSSSIVLPAWLSVSPRESPAPATANSSNCSVACAVQAGHDTASCTVSDRQAFSVDKSSASSGSSSMGVRKKSKIPTAPTAAVSSSSSKPSLASKAGMLLSATAPVGLLLGSSTGGRREQQLQPVETVAKDKGSLSDRLSSTLTLPCKARSRSATSSSSTTPRSSTSPRSSTTDAARVGNGAAAVPVAIPLAAALLSPRCLSGAAALQQADAKQ